MQMPRRTSEFQVDPNYIQRNSRSLQWNNLCASPSAGNGMAAAYSGSAAKKYTNRPSRICVPSRPSSNERPSYNNTYLSVPTNTQRGVTPQKTPLRKTSLNRILLTAEKQRSTPVSKSYSIPLHNDKKWVQEATQRITEYLLKQGNLNGGIKTEFLERGLRQISIKQFIAIINHFLSYICGNRFTVGSNYVDDIISIMQKLKYPYTLNKSWLKTPNTPHSFGNVVVLFDFLMEFVPPTETEEMYFNLEQPKDFFGTKINETYFQIPDLEFQQQLLSNTEKGFLLWDKQKIEELNNLKQETCNILLKKVCNVDNLNEMELEIQKSKEILKSLEKETPPEEIEMKKQKILLSRDLKKLNHDIKSLQAKCETNERSIKGLTSQKILIAKEVQGLEEDLKTLQKTLNKQSCTIEQRYQMLQNVTQLKQMLAIKKRAIQDVENHYHDEQIQKSKSMKQLSEQIEQINAHIRQIKFSNILKLSNNTLFNDSDLELSLRPHISDVEKLKTQLEDINQISLQNISENEKKTFQLQEQCKLLKIELDAKLYPKLNRLKTYNINLAADLQKLEHSYKKKENELLEMYKNVNEDLGTAQNTTKELLNLIKEKKHLAEELKESNEQTMKNAEEKHQQRLEQKKTFLKHYEESLKTIVNSEKLQKLKEQVEQQQQLLEELNKEF